MPTRLRRIASVIAFALLADTAAAALQVEPLVLDGQSSPSVTATPLGEFVITAINRLQGASQLHTQMVDAVGQPQPAKPVAQGDDWFVNWADFSSLAVAGNGDWVSFILRKSDPSIPYAYDIWVLRSEDRGDNWSAARKLNDDATVSEHGFVSLVADNDPSNADVVTAIWLDGRKNAAAADHGDGHGAAVTTLRSARIARDRISASFELDDLTCDCCTTDAVSTGADLLVLYRDRTLEQIRDIGFVKGRGEAWSKPAIVDSDHWLMPGCPVNGPALSAHGTGWLAAWPTMRGDTMVIRAARFDGASWQVLADIDQGSELGGRVDLAPWPKGRALISWLGADQGKVTLNLGVLNAQGVLVDRQVVATLPPGRTTGMPRIAAHADRAVLVWTEPTDAGARVAGVLIREVGAD